MTDTVTSFPAGAESKKSSLVLKDSFQRQDLQKWNEKITDTSVTHRRLAFYVFIGIFVFGGIWATFVELGGAVIASGRIIAEDRNQLIQHLEGGIIEKLFVREGDKIEAGAILARLDGTQAQPLLRSMKLRKAIFRAQLARYRAEIDMADTIVFPTDIDPSIASADSLVEAIESQKSEFAASRRVLNARLAISKTQEDAAAGRVIGQKEALAADEKAADLYRLELADREELYRKEVLQRTVLFQTRRESAEADARVVNRRLEVLNAEGEVISYQNQQEQYISDYLKNANNAVVQIQKELNELHQQIERQQDVVNRLDIKSPTKGTVFRVLRRSSGEVVRSGDVIMEIFPDTDRLTIEASVKITDIEQVFTGQEVSVVFPSNRDKAMLQIPGKITYLSADSVVTEQNPMGSYVAYIEVDPDQQIQEILPGMVAEVYIKTEPQTFLEILARPITRFLFRSFKG